MVGPLGILAYLAMGLVTVFTALTYSELGAAIPLDNARAAAFTPIPFKVFTIASGVFDVRLPTLLAASVLGRGLRFFAVASLLRWAG
ncbi:MAG: hypothetical protein IH926_08235, partial [Proteobacteria bacterium]|nr:hypothetical protein [Pseudomonadota bacterium]